MPSIRIPLTFAILLAGLSAAATARAQSCSANVPDIYFGNVPTPVPQVDVAAPVSVECSGTPDTTVRLCLGIAPATGPAGTRRMVSGADALPYALSADPSHTRPWDDGPAQRVLLAIPLGASGQGNATPTLYARMAAGGAPAAGRYQSSTTDDTLVGEIKPGNSQCGNPASTGTFSGGRFDVAVFVAGRCTVSVDPLLDFGTVAGAITAPVDAGIALRATCNRDLPYTVALGDGLHAAGSQRRMRSAAGDVLDYDLFQDAARSLRWGDGTPDPVRNGTGTGAQETLTIHGRVPAGQAAPGGTYRDTVTATITY